jgi:two-component system OmpR family response regulator
MGRKLATGSERPLMAECPLKAARHRNSLASATMTPVPTSTHAGRVLVVDDEPSIRDAVGTALRYEGFDVAEAATGRQALDLAGEQRPDVVILDLMLPDIDGIAVCRLLRQADLDCHVLFLSARGNLANKVTGLAAGGDDYITKPFSLAEIVARTNGVMRRRLMAPRPDDASEPPGLGATPPSEGGQLVCGDVVLDPGSHQVWRAGVAVHVTATEFRLLTFLLQNAQRVLSKQQILEAVWDDDFRGTPNIVEAYIGHLRRKLDRHGPPLIETIRLVGYVLHPHGVPKSNPR